MSQMTWEDADRVLIALEREETRHVVAYGTQEPSALIVLPDVADGKPVRLADVVDAMRFFRREAL